MSKIKLIKQDHHRNGICGASFNVMLFKDTDGATMLGIVFDNKHNSPGGYCAVFDLDLLSKQVIEFGENSWRGDSYEDALRALLPVYE